MAKVFRLYKEGASVTGWNSSPAFPYNSTARATIDDPDGASARNEITSIPSPFARIDLVKTAFAEVCRRKDLDGESIYHKMVSDTLDVGEIFFNIDKLKGIVDIITWNCDSEISQLEKDGNDNHYYLADALKKYLKSDASTYNFDKMNNVYLLNYVNGPDELNIIGATSPATLFFCGANKLDYVNDIFFQNNDRPFDSEYQPLYKRDFEYLKAWWVLRKTISEFATLFPEIDEYLDLTFRALTDQRQKQELNQISAANIDDFSVINVQSLGAVDQVEVLGYQLLKKKGGISNRKSEFTINSNKVKDNAPLVLPIEAGNKYSDLEYVNGKWGNKNKADFVDNLEPSSRTLPFDGFKYPYLTIGDFLEDTLFMVDHMQNSKDYFNGNLQEKSDKPESYLLPIKPLYFKFFSPEDLMSTMPDGQKTFEMAVVAGGSVKVALRIPILGNSRIKYIEYTRLYYVNRQPNVTANANEGGITAFSFAGFVMPGIKFQNDSDAYYNIAYISTFSNEAKLSFYKDNNLITGAEVDCRNKQRGIFDYKTDAYTLKSNFDFIEVNREDGRRGIIVPSFVEIQGIETYEFAVDLGTSNTHIEMKRSTDNVSIPFMCEESDLFMSKFFVPSFVEIEGNRRQKDLKSENDVIDADFIPSVIGANDFSFPTRTAMSCAKDINWNDSNRVLGLLNFCMTYDKKKQLLYNSDPLVNIKWSNEPNAQEAMRLYVENLMLLIRNKVLSLNGNLASTKITWFYPNSMSKLRLGQLRVIWNQSYEKLFSPSGVTRNISESVAPIKYYFTRYSTATNLVNIDIGGGTTDVAFSAGGTVDYITSFRFAANSLFEDSFSSINPNNGIIDWFKEGILDLLKTKSNDLTVIFNRNDGHPSNMASFLFSLKDNSATKGLNINKIDFNALLLNDDKFKVVFVLFYTAIIYHVAQIVKVKKLSIPRHVSFSGNGSRIIGVITSDAKLLADYTKVIFETVTGQKCSHPLEILGMERNNNPKEATCKGGLLPFTADDDPQRITLKTSDGEFISTTDTYSFVESHLEDIEKSVRRFFNFVFYDIQNIFNLGDNFGISRESLDIARDVCKQDLDTYLDKGFKLSEKESGDAGNVVEEALSFYPIKGVLQALSTNLYNNYKSNGIQ